MKLYGYSFYDGKMNCKEVEVEEKPKTYKALSMSFPFIYRTMLNKSDIGSFLYRTEQRQGKGIVFAKIQKGTFWQKGRSVYIGKESKMLRKRGLRLWQQH